MPDENVFAHLPALQKYGRSLRVLNPCSSPLNQSGINQLWDWSTYRSILRLLLTGLKHFGEAGSALVSLSGGSTRLLFFVWIFFKMKERHYRTSDLWSFPKNIPITPLKWQERHVWASTRVVIRTNQAIQRSIFLFLSLIPSWLLVHFHQFVTNSITLLCFSGLRAPWQMSMPACPIQAKWVFFFFDWLSVD